MTPVAAAAAAATAAATAAAAATRLRTPLRRGTALDLEIVARPRSGRFRLRR